MDSATFFKRDACCKCASRPIVSKKKGTGTKDKVLQGRLHCLSHKSNDNQRGLSIYFLPKATYWLKRRKEDARVCKDLFNCRAMQKLSFIHIYIYRCILSVMQPPTVLPNPQQNPEMTTRRSKYTLIPVMRANMLQSFSCAMHALIVPQNQSNRVEPSRNGCQRFGLGYNITRFEPKTDINWKHVLSTIDVADETVLKLFWDDPRLET